MLSKIRTGFSFRITILAWKYLPWKSRSRESQDRSETLNGQRYGHFNCLTYKHTYSRDRQGLRGVASILVVTSHLARALSPLLLSPGLEDSHPTLLQLPFLRLPFQGPPWVALFFLLTGYVNAMRPIKQARAGDAAGALGSISSSALRRTSRLVLPTTVATIVSATICFLGGYRLAKSCDSDWIRDSSPDRAANVPDALRLLVWNIFTTWSMGANIYDPVQWTLFLLLQASMSVYLLLLATVRVTPRYRMLAAVALYAFSWAGRDCKFLGHPSGEGAVG